MKKYKVYMRSRPGMLKEQYHGFIDVLATNEDEAIEAAFRKLRIGAFPNRTRSMWVVEKIERDFNPANLINRGTL
jgi:hypothetical protein